MDKSKLISQIIARLKLAYPYFFEKLTDEEFIGLISMYQEMLKEFDDETLKSAITSIIKKSKFMPSINEILDECNFFKKKSKNKIIELMEKDNYFKSVSEIEKAYKFLENDNIPNWFLKDLKKYGYVDNYNLLENETKKYLN